MKMFQTPTLIDQSDYQKSLLDIIRDFDSGKIKKPKHQRNKVWKPDQDIEWVNRISGSLISVEYIKPVGTLLTYQLLDDPTRQIYLNDGYQRITATKDYIDNPFEYNDTKDNAISVVENCLITIQHRHYPDHESAMVDFQLVNLGTHLTPFEFYKGTFVYVPQYETVWSPILKSIHLVINNASQRIVSKQRLNNTTTHKHLRHDYSLFYRFATKDKRLTSYQVGTKTVKSFSDAKNKNSIEWKLRDYFLLNGEDQSKSQLRLFCDTIDRETVMFRTFWYNDKRPINGGISSTLYRWLLDVAIWKRNNKKDNDAWKEFVKEVFAYGNGQIYVVNGDSRIQLSLGELAKLGNVCDALNLNLYRAKRTKHLSQYQGLPGTDMSGVTPDGQIGFPEASGLNRARGKKDVSIDDLPKYLKST